MTKEKSPPPADNVVATDPTAWLVKIYDNAGMLLDTRLEFVKPSVRSTARTEFVPLYAQPTPADISVGSEQQTEAEKIALLEERISSLEDELYEARQVPWPDWATAILKTLQKYGYDPVVDGEVDLGEAFKDYLEGIAQAEEQDKKRFRDLIERAQAIISTSTYPNWHATARAALATATEGSGE